MPPDNDKRMRAMLLTCNPGRSPVAIPVITPKTQKRMIKKKLGALRNLLVDNPVFVTAWI